MPEIKHQFTGGKMNKDVDERLVPNGEYRDAMNIQVSTSEGSDVGTIQNILGNSQINIPFDITKHRCVGSISDEKTNSVYFFLAGPKFDFNNNSASTGVFSQDYIIRLKDNSITIVFSDIKITIGESKAINSLPAFDYGDNIIYTPSSSSFSVNDVLKGDVLEAILIVSASSVVYTNNTVTHVSSVSPEFLVLDSLPLPQIDEDEECFLFFKSGCLKFDADRLITGINIIDDMLFWTDGHTEPKKINITRSIKGTNQNGEGRTLLINKDQGITANSNVFVEEKHVTVIKKAPSKAPRLKSLTSLREDSTLGEGVVDFTNGATTGALLKSAGDKLYVTIKSTIGLTPPNIKIGDTLMFNSEDSGQWPPDNYQVRANVTQKSTLTPTTIRVKIEIMSISSLTPKLEANYYVAISEEGYDLFERKFPRFACRYKYADGEYSSVGPFSPVAFVPGRFSYHPTEAYNKGMINNLKSLYLQDFIPTDIPKDVVQVDLLYKDEVSPEIYTVRSVRPTDTAWTTVGSYIGSFGSYEITTESIYAVLPSNQALRLWDNVPRTALSQEITGSRIVYANYLQNYNLETFPSVLAELNTRSFKPPVGVPQRSIKSLRTYNVGIVYGDNYGRETPVFADKSSNQIVPKEKATNASMLHATVESPHPEWASYYKFFVKETSNEYYNLALGRAYNAEDGNIWLSFPSIDRNKVDEDTYLILKKGVGGKAVTTKAKYKIVAIENEAPDYIKTILTVIARPVKWDGTVSTNDIFGGYDTGNEAKEPAAGVVSFYIDKKIWTEDTSIDVGLGQPDLEKQWQDKGISELWVSFIGDIAGTKQSKKYQITDVKFIESDAQGTDRQVYEVFITSPISELDDFVSNTYHSNGALYDMVHTDYRPIIYKKEIINKPEFDGRFFVKIKNDAITQNSILPEPEQDSSWRVQASTDLYHLRDWDAWYFSYDWLDPANNGTNIKVSEEDGDLDIPYPAQYEDSTGYAVDGVGTGEFNMHGDSTHGVFYKEHFFDLLGFGGGKVRNRWFIDQISYAGEQSMSTTNFSGLSHNGGDVIDRTSNQTYSYDDGFFGGDGSINSDYGTGFSLGKQFGQGIHNFQNTNTAHLPNGREHHLQLSFSAMQEQQSIGDSDGGDFWQEVAAMVFLNNNLETLNNDSWDISAQFPEQKNFVDQIKIGSKFRMANDATKVYTITNVEPMRLYSFRSWLPDPYWDSNKTFHGNDNWSKARWQGDLGLGANRRVSYDITYEIDGGDLNDDLNNNIGLFGTNPVNSLRTGNFQFIQPYNADEPEPIDAYPAIFETEPKESVDLDIYYEASGKIPTSITSGDGSMLIPIGSRLRIEPEILANIQIANATSVTGNSPPVGLDFFSGITVTGWGGSILNIGSQNLNNFYHNLINIAPHITIAQMLAIQPFSDDAVILQFDSPDGTSSYVELKQYSIDSNQMITGFLVETTNKVGLNWYNCWSFANGVESNRIGDTYNKPYLSNGPKASTTLDTKYEEENRKYGLIYSGIYNSTSGVNNLNQFIAAEKITKDLNPIYGSVQKLHSRSTADGDLIALCEDRVLKILANKDAVFNADGNPQLTATNVVLGQALPFSGEYGISKNPESFASESYRVYFADKTRGVVMRLSKDGLTPISSHGMKDWFRNNLKLSHQIKGSYDDKKDEYNVSLSEREQQTFTTSLQPVLKSTVGVMIQGQYI